MKTFKHIFSIIRWIAAPIVLLLALATFMGESYGQTLILVFIAIILIFWPAGLNSRLGALLSGLLRIGLILILFGMKSWIFSSPPKTSIYRSAECKENLMTVYDESMKRWPANTKSRFLHTGYGRVHVLETGSPEKPALVMLHAASMGAHSWFENLEPFLKDYHIFAIDNPGEGNKSELEVAMVFPATPEELADMYSDILDELGISNAVVFGASNGGFIAQVLAFYHPEKVSALALFGPMGLTQLTNGSIVMMGVSTMYPFQFLRDRVANWALGTAAVCHETYGDWFNAIMMGSIPSIAKPVPMTTEQKAAMDLPVILFLGTEDRIVGDAAVAESMAQDYPNIEIVTMKSGHLIAVEHADAVNAALVEFLGINDQGPGQIQ